MVIMSGGSEKVPLMTQGQWMKGCPEGSEQSFLFSLYRELSEGECPCPHGCGASVKRKKSDFFVLFVGAQLPLSAIIAHFFEADIPRIHQALAVNSAPDV